MCIHVKPSLGLDCSSVTNRKERRREESVINVHTCETFVRIGLLVCD